ncbi:DUF262 domain-containing protein [Flavobacterium sp. LB2P74]|uniref:DUF262 domain-containing protein n=1 Tax=Flavobacterium sp. LB2P74 TaxID=3401717 RepID=UPI003AAFE0FA
MIDTNDMEEFDTEEEKSLSEELTDINEPFDPKDIDIQAIQTTMDTIIKRLEHDEIDLNPDFQRSANLWKPQYMSRLIESLLIRFPLPAFYFDGTNDDKWQVVDGLQRLSTIKKFAVDKTLKLQKLEFLHQFEGLSYNDLPRNLQRRIDEAQITMYLIKPGTPINVKFSLFYRINTGGLQLKPQEIRHALSQGINDGQASKFLKRITETSLFKEVGRVSGKRMLDKELVLRHVALKKTNYLEYKPPMISFLNNAMEKLGNETEESLNILEDDILRAFKLSKTIFGDDAFRKSLVETGKLKVINRALFEAVSVLFSKLTDKQINNLLSNKDQFLFEFKGLFKDIDFYASITYSTAESTSVTTRFNMISKIINKYSK